MNDGDPELRPGENVRMWSGGPLMQVFSARPSIIRCVWRLGSWTHFGYFRPSMIVRAVDDQPKD